MNIYIHICFVLFGLICVIFHKKIGLMVMKIWYPSPYKQSLLRFNQISFLIVGLVFATVGILWLLGIIEMKN